MRRRSKRLTARAADKYQLYEKSVQDAYLDAKFLARRFPQFTGRPLRLLREDFCGTAKLICEFVKLHSQNAAIGIDRDRIPLRWCLEHNISNLTAEQQKRIRLIEKDAKTVTRPRVDAIVAFNFSYAIFCTRPDLLHYFKTVYKSLRPNSLFLLDSFGGKEVPVQDQVSWRVGSFRYVWEVTSYDPITNHIVCKIHFVFRDGSRMNNAFIYEWRLWSLPELRELLNEAGFKKLHILWEGSDPKTHLGNGVMREVKKGIYQESWYAIIVARK